MGCGPCTAPCYFNRVLYQQQCVHLDCALHVEPPGQDVGDADEAHQVVNITLYAASNTCKEGRGGRGAVWVDVYVWQRCQCHIACCLQIKGSPQEGRG